MLISGTERTTTDDPSWFMFYDIANGKVMSGALNIYYIHCHITFIQIDYS